MGTAAAVDLGQRTPLLCPDKASVLLERLAKNWVNILLRRRIE